MKRNQVFLIVTSALLLVSFQNCGGFQDSALNSGSTEMASNEAAVARAKGQAVLAARCASCHNETLASGGVDVTDENSLLFYRYVVPGEPQLSTLFNLIQDGEMPPQDPLTANEAQIISDWITLGFQDATTSAPAPSTELKPTYQSLAKNIFAPKCVSCHSGANASAGISLDTFNGVRNTVRPGDPASSGLYTSVATRKTMPRGGQALSAEQNATLQSWIMQGALNN